MPMLRLIEPFLQRHGMAAARFGREAVGDPNFVRELRRGREPREHTCARIAAFIAAREAASASAAPR